MSCTDEEIPFSMTPILEDSVHLLMLTCISVRENGSNRLIDTEYPSQISFRYSEGICPKVSMKASDLDMLSIRLTSLECMQPVYELWISVGTQQYKEAIKLPYLLAGSRASYFPVVCLNATVCIVHELVELTRDEIFVEEQEFMFTALDIQDRLFLAHPDPLPPVPYIESTVVDDSNDLFSKELTLLSSIMDKYTKSS